MCTKKTWGICARYDVSVIKPLLEDCQQTTDATAMKHDEQFMIAYDCLGSLAFKPNGPKGRVPYPLLG